MTKSLGKSRYSEYFIEYDVENNVVYVSGLSQGEFWEEFDVQTDVAEPESFAWGYHEALKHKGKFSTVERITI